MLALAALASSEADQDPIDAAIRAASKATGSGAAERLGRFVPFDPATKTAEAFAIDRDGRELRIVKGAFEVIARVAETPADARRRVDDLAEQGHRIIAVAAGSHHALRLAGLIALSDPPREDSAGLIATLRDMSIRTVMVTGDSAVTAAAIARKVGITSMVCPPERISDDPSTDRFGVFARVVPEQKYQLVKALQDHGHVVGMCGDGANDAPALRQAQIGIAVSTATDVAKAAAGMVMTEPGLAGIVFAVREGRIGFQRLLTYTFNMLVKKSEIVLFLAIGLIMTGHAVLTPALMVLLFMTNDFLSMSITTDRASPSPFPSVWRMRNITAAAVVLGLCKLGFSTAVLAFGKFQLGLRSGRAADVGVRHARVRKSRRAVRVARAAPHVEVQARQLGVGILSGRYCHRLGARAVGNLDGTTGVAGHCSRIHGCSRVRAGPRSDQAAGHVGVGGRTTNRAMEICGRDAPIDLQQVHACQRPGASAAG